MLFLGNTSNYTEASSFPGNSGENVSDWSTGSGESFFDDPVNFWENQDNLWGISLFFISLSLVYVCFVLICGVSWEFRDQLPGRILGAVRRQRDKHTWVLVPSKRDYDACELLNLKEDDLGGNPFAEKPSPSGLDTESETLY